MFCLSIEQPSRHLLEFLNWNMIREGKPENIQLVAKDN